MKLQLIEPVFGMPLSDVLDTGDKTAEQFLSEEYPPDFFYIARVVSPHAEGSLAVFPTHTEGMAGGPLDWPVGIVVER